MVASQYDGMGTHGSSSGECDPNDEGDFDESSVDDSIDDDIPQFSSSSAAAAAKYPSENVGSPDHQDPRNRTFSDGTAGEKADDELDSDIEML
jgi:hypothetical protein